MFFQGEPEFSGGHGQQLRRTALELFATHGYHGMSMGMLVVASKLARATIYGHAKSKDELFRALWADSLERVAHRARGTFVDFAKDCREQFDSLWKVFVRVAEEDPWLVRFMVHTHDDLHGEARELLRDPERAVHLWLRRWMNYGSLRPVAPEVAVAVLWGIFEQTFRVADTPEKLRTEALLVARDCAWEALRAQAAAAQAV